MLQRFRGHILWILGTPPRPTATPHSSGRLQPNSDLICTYSCKQTPSPLPNIVCRKGALGSMQFPLPPVVCALRLFDHSYLFALTKGQVAFTLPCKIVQGCHVLTRHLLWRGRRRFFLAGDARRHGRGHRQAATGKVIYWRRYCCVAGRRPLWSRS